MKILDYRDDDFDGAIDSLNQRTAFPDDISQSVAEILKDIQANGDAAVIRYAEKFDQAKLSAETFLYSEADIAQASAAVGDDVKTAIKLAHANVSRFSKERLPKDWSFNPRDGVELGERFVPLQRIAAYIPGGAAPLVSTVLHTITMAQVAGVEEIVIVSPASSSGEINPAIVYAATIAGATEIYRLGGVYAIGAMAYGTETIKKVDKIVGPGNAYVTAAKRHVYGHVALDLVAGPSEVLIIADSSADPAFIAADMLAQAEHGSGMEQAVLVTTEDDMIKSVQDELSKQSAELLRKDLIQKVLDNGIYLIRVQDLSQAVDVTNAYAPEHLEIMTTDARALANEIRCAGAIFLGNYTPEPVGDFVAGPSHVLPTGGAARYFNGLTVDQFCRRISMVEYSQEALTKEREAIKQFAKIEELDAHGNSVEIRFKEEL
ncbi:MAG: histidinol dehydrogenase [Lentisphaeria bacterium]|nr:histidinol dehydrogenase [Lentisphaeria bacterium]NQZ67392.1 histidinol dehydrogenase [Lentisphaeria bacterium]